MRVNVFIISWWHNTASKLLAQQLFSISFLRQTQSVWRNENISKVNENIMIIIINIINSIHSKSFQQQHTHNISIYTFIYLRNIPIRSSLYCLLLNMWTQYNGSGSETLTLRSGLSLPSWRELGRLVFNISTHGNFVFSRVWHDGHPCRRKVLTFSKYLIRYFQTYKHELQKGEHSSGNTIWYWMLLAIVEVHPWVHRSKN